MILKELDPFTGSDKFAVAGRRAEEQMAHYLKWFFGASTEVDVLNYLRIDLQGEVAQMDHLVLHPLGLTIVESKSVAGSVQIKDDGQWIRWFNKQPQGMRSPVTQARMQGMLLKSPFQIRSPRSLHLCAHAADLARAILGRPLISKASHTTPDKQTPNSAHPA